ncbi:MAG: hypothetical protein AAGF73_11975 [Actinomycetota bacterium]
MPHRVATVAGIALGALLGCGGADGDDARRQIVFDCIVDGGRAIGDSADVFFGGGQALAVIDVEVSEDVLDLCLDAASR